MTLEKYIEKRDFKKTAEPKPEKKSSKKELKFVVQRHHASHLHYDFRLEMEGVLKSWAIPKGPSLNPRDKRLAMMVEDHPYDYRTFEGVIPPGNYGAGLVTIFDEGTYETPDGKSDEKALLKALNKGDLKFRLKGRILKGEFALVKLKDGESNAWLLIKHKDEFAVSGSFDSENLIPESVKKKGIEIKKAKGSSKGSTKKIKEMPDPPPAPAFEPMLAKLSSEIFDDADWVYEKKLDGYRALAYTGKKVKLISRNGIDFTSKYAAVVKALTKIKEEAILDGELVVEDQNGKADFQEIQNYNPSNKKLRLKYYVFDLLSLNGHDIRQLELIKRKELLKKLISAYPGDEIIYSEHVSGSGKKLLNTAREEGWEGIIAKKASGIYQSGKRSDDWRKFKIQVSQEAVIIGFSKPAGSRNYFGSLVLGMFEGDRLVYIGNCGTGFTEASLKEVYEELSKLKTDQKPVAQKVEKEKSVTWVKPELVCEVRYSEWTGDKHLRHPVFKGLRMDKSPREVQKETTSIDPDKKTDLARSEIPDELEEVFGKKVVRLTNLNKLFWKKEKITKGQLIAYYRQIADYILPYLKDRPLSLNRHPHGIDTPGFFQKDLDTKQIPDWIKYAPIYSESNQKTIDYLICNDHATLLWMVNLGCIEINPWLSTFKKPEHPLFAVMDLDPQDVDFKEVVKVALTARQILNEMEVESFIKTSGSRGMHIFIYVGARYEYDLVKSFIHYLGQLIHSQHPEITSLERSPSKRKTKIYLDYLQNRRGQTIAAPYSVRPKPGATVSTPLDWDEVNEELDIRKFTIFNTIERINEKGELWKDITKTKTDLKAALKKLKNND